MDSKEHFAVAQIQPIVYEMILFKFGYTYTLMEGLTLPRVFLPNSYTWKKTTDSLQKEIAKGSFCLWHTKVFNMFDRCVSSVVALGIYLAIDYS